MPFWLLTLLRLSVSGGIIIWLVYQVDLAVIGPRLNNASLWRVTLVFCLFMLQGGLASWRWQRVNRRLNIDLPFAWHIRHFLISLFFGQALPAAVGGDVVRVWHLGNACGSPGAAIHSIVVDRMIGLVTLLLLTVISLPFFISGSTVPEMNSAIVLVVGGGILGVALLLVFGGMLKRLERFKSARRVMAAIEIFHNLCLDRRECISQCLIGLAVHLSSIFAFLMLGWALRVPLDVFAGIAILPAVLLVAGLPVSIAGWGVREGGMVAGFSLLGLPASDALILSIAFGLGELGVGLVGGILWLLAGRRDSCATLPSFWSGSAAADPPP